MLCARSCAVVICLSSLEKETIVSMLFLMSTGAKEVKNHHNQILRKLVKVFPRLPLILQYIAPSLATYTPQSTPTTFSQEVISSFIPGPLHCTSG